MASTSTSSFQKSFKYDVFLSFRGEDTRNNFVSHLYKALEQKGILTYKDDEKIEKGEMIDTQLMKSIEDSRFFIIVFSKDYASSLWCLDELVKIMECQKATEQAAYPVFYDVEPTEVRKQSGEVEKAFKKHETKEAAVKWRKALTESSNLAGWESNKNANGDESKLIQIIVNDISKKISSTNLSVDVNLVGMETRIEAFLSSLELDTNDFRMLGIWGMGGGGKTTLARAVFDRISIQFRFDGIAFVENVREVSKSSLYGLNKLQQQILSSVLSKENITVSSVHEGTNMMKRMIRGRKVLIVLDDVDDTEQLEALAGEPSWFKFGSRVIITTRDKKILLSRGVKVIDVSLLSPAEAICLLSKNAFKREIPIEGYEELSRQVVKYAHGLPLTIKLLGSLLCGQNEPQWKHALERLKTIPLKETMKILELSYDALDDDCKEIFLDVACLLKGWSIDDVVIALESCGFFAEGGLRVLEQRSLITISDGKLQMHDHIEEMGMNIVRRVNPNEPEKHSRLWSHKELVDIFAHDMVPKKKWWWKLAGNMLFEEEMVKKKKSWWERARNMLVEEEKATQATQCIRVDTYAGGSNFKIIMKGIADVKELRFLHVDMSSMGCSSSFFKWKLPNALRFLRWDDYPFSSLPKTFQINNLVGLDMHCSQIKSFREDGEEKPLLKLRFLKFTYSHDLRTLDLRFTPNLETLILDTCYGLKELDFHVTPNLKELRIIRCKRLEELHMPAESPKLRSVYLYRLKFKTLHLGIAPNLETVRLSYCTDMVKLRMPAECPKLVKIDLFHLNKLRTFHVGITPNLKTVSLKDCCDLFELKIPAECPKLVTLDLFDNLKLRTLELGLTPKLRSLNISHCGRFKSFKFHKKRDSPKVISLSDLHLMADANDVDDTGICDPGNISCYYKEGPASSFGNLGRLISLGFGARLNVDSFSDIICGLQCLRKLTLKGGIPEAPKNLDRLDCLEELSLKSTYIKTLPDSVSMLKHLKSLEIVSCCLLEKLPEDIGRLQCLEKLIVKDCIFLRDIPNSICEMDRLECLDLTGCFRIEELPEVIGCLKYLKELDITGSGITRLPKSIYQLRGLRIIGDVNDDDVEDVDEGGDEDNDEDGDGDGGEDDDNDNEAEDVDGEFDYEYARTLVMMLLGSRT